MTLQLRLLAAWSAVAVIGFTRVFGDDRVIVSATADPAYTQKKFGGEKPRQETYVVMAGNYISGATVDRTLERMPLRKIMGYLATELAKREYWPAKSANHADLLLVVHWGVTMPVITSNELLGRTNPGVDGRSAGAASDAAAAAAGNGDLLTGFGEAANLNAQYADDMLTQMNDSLDAEVSQSNTARLLGYTAALRQYENSMLPSVEETTLRRSMQEERYFVIVSAYDLREWKQHETNRSIWTIRLNIGSPGNNFDQAMARMSMAGSDFFGRSTTTIGTVRTRGAKGSVMLAPLVILGEAK